MPAPEAMVGTVGAALAAAEQRLRDAGMVDPRRAAGRIAAALTGCLPGELWLTRDQPLGRGLAQQLAAAVDTHARGWPLAYATGRIGFRTLELACDARALIPRPETEGLVDLVLGDRRHPRPAGGLAADLGTGTGCLALALAVEGAFDGVIAVERDPRAAALARENVARARPKAPVEVREGDWLAPLGDARYRVIVSNPPYLTDAEWTVLDPAVRDYEPQHALASGADGLAATRTILAGAGRVLEAGGILALEVDERRAAVVRDLAIGFGWARARVHEDLFGRPRYLVAVAEETR